MSEKRARFVGHPDGVDLNQVPVGTEGEFRRVRVAYGGELPTEIDGLKVPASFRDSLLEQQGNWTRSTGRPAMTKAKTAATADEKKEG
jgi:hypothetical protein